MANIDKTSNTRLRKFCKRPAGCAGLTAVDIKTKQELIKKSSADFRKSLSKKEQA